MKNMAIKLYITGGTIDEIGRKHGKSIFDETHIPLMLKQGRSKTKIDYEVLMLKDSSDITDSDREKILQKCQSCKENRIIITHGTITMVKTAEFLGKNMKGKTIVLLGAMVPYNQENSDALFNLGSAITSVQLLPKGVYIAMNGKIFTWGNVRKNKELDEFEELK